MHKLNSLPFLACGGEPSRMKNFLTQIQHYCSERGFNSLIQCLLRRDYLFAITNDYRLHISKLNPVAAAQSSSSEEEKTTFDLLTSCGLEESIGIKRVYRVAASYTHCLILVDEIVVEQDQDLGVDQEGERKYKVKECNEMFLNVLPSGETINVPRRSSLLAFEMSDYWSNVLVGNDAIQLNINKTSELPRGYLIPFSNDFKEDEFITYMTCASSSSVLVTNLGRVFVLGSNGFGECGISRYQNVTSVTLSPYFQTDHHDLFICKVACGDHSIFALDRNGLIHCTGYNYYGELAVGRVCDVVDGFEPSKEINKYLESDPAIDISCRYYGVIVLTKSGKIYTTGSGALKIEKIEKPYLFQERSFNRVLGVGTNNSAFLLCAENRNDLLIQLFGYELEYDFSETEDNEISEHSSSTRMILLEKGANLLNSCKYRIALTGSDNTQENSLLCYIQSYNNAESVLQNNLRKHIFDYVEEGRKSLADIIVNFD